MNIINMYSWNLQGFLECPAAEALISFNPMSGFSWSATASEDYSDPSGDYLCIGSLNGTNQVVEYQIRRLPVKIIASSKAYMQFNLKSKSGVVLDYNMSSVIWHDIV
jgi:hypothetical protein